MTKFASIVFGGVGLGALMAAGPAWAQTPASPPEATAPPVSEESENSPRGDVVVIHARRREELLTDVPLAVTALDEQALEDRSVARIEDIGTLAPNVFIKSSSSGAASIEVLIRGQIVAISNPANDPPVGLYYDDVYVAQSKGAGGAVFDMEGVEVSRGVQGTLSGRNNTGGAIRFYSHKPVLGRYEGELSGSYGTNNLNRASMIVNVPLGETFALRGGYSYNHQDEQGRSVITGDPFQGVDQQFARLSALWEPSASFSNHFVYEWTKIDQPQMSIHPVAGTNVSCAVIAGTATCPPSTVVLNPTLARHSAGVVIPPGIHDTSWNFRSDGDKVDVDFFRNTTIWDVSPDLTAKLIVGYRDMSAVSSLDVDATPGFLAHADRFGALSKQITVEPQLEGTLFEDRLNWVVGYFYFEDDAEQPSRTFTPTLQINLDDKLVNTSNAVYAHGEFSLTDRWRVAAGARYTEDEREYHPYRSRGVPPNDICLLNNNGVPLSTTGPCPAVNLNATFDYWSYEFSTNYEFTDKVTGYFRLGRGQKSGGFTSPLTAINTPAFEPEQVDDYEVGLKTAGLFGGALDANLAVFYGDYQNMQRYTSGLVPGAGISSQTLNAGAATVQGVEGDFGWRATDQLTINGFLGYTDAQYDEFIVLSGTGTGTAVDLSNNRWYQTPEFTSRLGFTYDVPMSSGDLRFGAGWYHQTSSSMYVLEFPQLIQDAYSLFDARASWTSPDERWEFSVWGTNLSDEEYAVGATASPANPFNPAAGLNSAGLVPGDESTIGMTLKFLWGQ